MELELWWRQERNRLRQKAAYIAATSSSVHPPWADDAQQLVSHLLKLPGCHDRELVLMLVVPELGCVPGNLQFAARSEREKLPEAELQALQQFPWRQWRGRVPQKRLARAAGVSQATVSKLENGQLQSLGGTVLRKLHAVYCELAGTG